LKKSEVGLEALLVSNKIFDVIAFGFIRLGICGAPRTVCPLRQHEKPVVIENAEIKHKIEIGFEKDFKLEKMNRKITLTAKAASHLQEAALWVCGSSSSEAALNECQTLSASTSSLS
jgi:hypothetical protein